MTALLDVVNFNADASCLESRRWLRALEGEAESEFCQWLRLYVDRRKKMILGLTGATVADLAAHNPDALEIIRVNADVFETVARPFSHDVALIRSREGFAVNVKLGAAASRRQFQAIPDMYLPPEFMLSNEQIGLLIAAGMGGVFVNAERLTTEMRPRIPKEPYWVRGLGGSRMRCLPVKGDLTRAYLDALHEFASDGWNQCVAMHGGEPVLAWRDGESPFLIPDGLKREGYWLDNERGIERCMLSEIEFDYRDNDDLAPEHLRSYPVHSFQAWMKEFRMIGYLGRMQQLEQHAEDFPVIELALWFQVINSDVLSAVEKRSIKVQMRSVPGSRINLTHNLLRSERGFEGEEYLRLLELARSGRLEPLQQFLESSEAHAKKFRGRFEYLKELCAAVGFGS